MAGLTLADIKKWSTKKLKKEYLGLYDVIYVSGVYGTADMMLLGAIGSELAKRGYEFDETSMVKIRKVV